MKIISKFTDFYDYVVGLVGVDTERPFYRIAKENNDPRVTEAAHKLSKLYKELRVGNSRFGYFRNHVLEDSIIPLIKDYVTKYGMLINVKSSYIMIGSKLVRCISLVRTHSKYNKNELVERRSEIHTAVTYNKLIKLLSSDLFSTIESNKKDLNRIIGELEKIREKTGMDTFGTIQDFQNDIDCTKYPHVHPISELSNLTEAPVVLFCGTYPKYNEAFVLANPVLMGTGVEELLDPIETYQNIEMVVSSIQDIEKETIISNDVKIESKGFDLKTSFRKGKRK